MNNVPPHDIVQSNEIIELLKNEDALSFIEENFDKQPDMLSLKYSGKVAFDLTKLTQILQLYRKAKDKIPLWVENKCAMHSKSYEQSSHWQIAKFKSTLLPGNSILDLTSGLGVDSYYFAQHFKHVTSIEKDKVTYEFAAFNATRLKVPHITHLNQDLTEFKLDRDYDVIYLDPDRRANDDRALGNIDAYSPNILEWHTKWLQHTGNLLIKLSPMVDISFLETTFDFLHTSYVISFKNEVKEVLIHLTNKRSTNKKRISVDLDTNQIKTYTNEIRPKSILTTNVSGEHLYEPSRALIKSGLAQTYCSELRLAPTHQNGLYFLSNEVIPNFIGRRFDIINRVDCNWKSIKKYLKTNGIKRIQITQRHFYDDVKTIRAKLKIDDGGDAFLQFTIDDSGKPLCYHSKLKL